LPIRVLVAEDSPVMRDLIVAVLRSDQDVTVVGQAINGAEAVALAASLRPDVITMDIRMPVIDGFEATKRIMSESPTRIVVVSSSVDPDEVKIAFNALKLGAVAVVEKPRAPTHAAFQAVRHELLTTIKVMADVRVVRGRPDRVSAVHSVRNLAGPTAHWNQVIAIAASTGGPAALAAVLQDLPPDLSIPILVVQHISPGFEPGLAQWLGSLTPRRVRLAKNGERLNGGGVLLGPGDCHLGVAGDGDIALSQVPPVSGHRPSATYLFRSVAKTYGPRAVGVILTGMGEDGADGMKELRDAGGQTIAQDETSCVVFGMPKAAIARGAVDYVEPLSHIADRIMTLVASRGGRGR